MECNDQQDECQMWASACYAFIIIRIVIMVCKWPAVKAISMQAMCDSDSLKEINFKTTRNLRDTGYFLVASFVFDLIALPANIVFLMRITRE
jgi:L-lactate permease